MPVRLKTRRSIEDVCGALIERGGRFLVAKRKPQDSFGGLWEFPGGGIEPGEEKEQCLKRELKEELGVDAEVGRLIHIFEDEIPGLKINVFLFACRIRKGTPRPLECQEVRWVKLDRLITLKLAQADEKIANWLLARRKSGYQGKAKR